MQRIPPINTCVAGLNAGCWARNTSVVAPNRVRENGRAVELDAEDATVDAFTGHEFGSDRESHKT